MGIFTEWLVNKPELLSEYGEIATRWDTTCNMCDTPIKKNERCFFNKEYPKETKRRLVCPTCYKTLSPTQQDQVEKRPEVKPLGDM